MTYLCEGFSMSLLIILHGQILGRVFWEEEEHEMPRIFLFSFRLWSLGPGKGVFCKSVFLVVSFWVVDLKEMQWSLWDHMLARWLCFVIILNLLVHPQLLCESALTTVLNPKSGGVWNLLSSFIGFEISFSLMMTSWLC
jgi:hypothetical protein